MRDETFTFARLRARVCIGMPVRNGQRHIAQAIDSIISQSFGDLELIISDDASTDGTEEICRSFANHDSRITYTRLPQSIGAVRNYERAYRLSGGQYFKWAAFDDILEPTFIEKSVLALDADPSAVLAYSRSILIDDHGDYLKGSPPKLATDSDLPHQRFAAIALADHGKSDSHEIFGLIRRSSADRVPQQGDFPASDRIFLARLALYGRFLEIPDQLFLSRDRSERPGCTPLTSADTTLFPQWRLAWEYLRSIEYGWHPTPVRLACTGSILKRQLSRGNWARMLRDFYTAGSAIAGKLLPTAAPTIPPPKPTSVPHARREMPAKRAA